MQTAEIWVHSDSNRNLGLFLMFLGAVAAILIPPLLSLAEVQGPVQPYATLAGLVLIVLGMALLQMTRKRYRVESNKITVKDGIFTTPKVFHWEPSSKIQLRSYEDEHGEWWLVDLVTAKPHYGLQRSLGHASESRSLAVALARAMSVPLLESNESDEVLIPPEELELPFAERLRRHPQLLGPDLPQPAGCSVKLVEEQGSLRFRWKLTPGQILPYFLALLLFVVALAGAPLFPGTYPIHYQDWRGAKLQRTAFERARLQGNYDYFLLCGGFLASLTSLAIGYRKQLRATPTGLSCNSQLWGMPLSKSEIPVAEFREIWVRKVRNGAYLQFLSKKHILGGRVSDIEVAHWVASRVGHYYAQLAADEEGRRSKSMS
jgi:xanthosine utilization system XapX-like protein